MTPRKRKSAKTAAAEPVKAAAEKRTGYHSHWPASSPGFGVTRKFPAPGSERLVEDEGEQLVDEPDEDVDPKDPEQNVQPQGDVS